MSERRPNPLAWIMPLSAMALAAGILIGRVSDIAWVGVVGVGVALLAMVLYPGRTRRAAFLMFVVCVGFLRGYDAYHPRIMEEGSYTITGVVADEVRLREDKGQVRTILRQVAVDGHALNGGAYWTGYPEAVPEDLKPGVWVRVTARVYRPKGEDNPGGFHFQEYLLQRGITIGVYGMDEVSVMTDRFSVYGWMARVRHMLTERLNRALGEEVGAYAAAMLLGNRELITSEDRVAFNRLGIAHILSVSGYHVGVLAGLLAALFRLLRMPSGWRTIMTGIALAGYSLLTGMNPPVVRASALVVLYQLGKLQHRQNIGLHLLSLSAVLILLVSPAQLMGASFQLTYGAMLGLLLVFPRLERMIGLKRGRFRGLWSALCAAFAAQLGILMPQIYWFQKMPLLALPLNIVVLAGAGVLLSLHWLELVLLISPPVAAFVGKAVGCVTELVLRVIRALSSMEGIELWVKQPNAVSFLSWAAMIAMLSTFWPKRFPKWHALIGAAIFALSLVPWPYSHVTYTQLSVGNADAGVLRDRDMVVVVDVGEDGDALATFLKQRRLSIDKLIITHLHSDHVGGIRALLDDHIPVKTVYLPEGAEQAAIEEEMLSLLEELLAMGTELHHLSRGDTIELPDGRITAVWPESGRIRAGMDANLYSLVLHVQLFNTTMLLTGDMDGAYERYTAVPADILKVAHHGSKSSTSAEYLEAVSPGMLMLSCGDDIRYESMMERRGNASLYATQAHGTVMIDFTEDGYTVQTMRKEDTDGQEAVYAGAP